MKLKAKTVSTARVPPDATTYRTGCLPRDLPILPKRVPVEGCFHFFDGQKRALPSTDTRAGKRVSAATRVTPTAIASDGPIERKMPSDERARVMNATNTAAPADAIASPARSSACSTATLCSSPARMRSR